MSRATAEDTAKVMGSDIEGSKPSAATTSHARRSTLSWSTWRMVGAHGRCHSRGRGEASRCVCLVRTELRRGAKRRGTAGARPATRGRQATCAARQRHPLAARDASRDAAARRTRRRACGACESLVAARLAESAENRGVIVRTEAPELRVSSGDHRASIPTPARRGGACFARVGGGAH